MHEVIGIYENAEIYRKFTRKLKKTSFHIPILATRHSSQFLSNWTQDGNLGEIFLELHHDFMVWYWSFKKVAILRERELVIMHWKHKQYSVMEIRFFFSSGYVSISTNVLYPLKVHFLGTWSHVLLPKSHMIYISLHTFAGFREERQTLTLLELPSIFTPEDWSFTFFEGINRLPDSVFRDRDLAELGCGNGWISIAIAEKWSPRKVETLTVWVSIICSFLPNLRW